MIFFLKKILKNILYAFQYRNHKVNEIGIKNNTQLMLKTNVYLNFEF